VSAAMRANCGRMLFVVFISAAIQYSAAYKQKIPTYKDEYTDGYPGEMNTGNLYFKRRILYAAMFGIVAALITFVAFCLWFCCRCAACLCMDANDYEGNCCRRGTCCHIFCQTGGPNKRGYSRRQRIALWAILVFVTAWVVICSLMGGYGVHQVVDGAEEVFDQAMAAIGTMESMNMMLQDGMTQLAMSFNGTEMDTAISSVKTSVGDVETKVDDNVEEIKYGAYVFYFCFVSNMLLGTFSFLCSSNFACCGYWSMAMAVFGWVLTGLCWLLFAVFYASGAFLDDTCVQLQLWSDCKQLGANTTTLGCQNLAIQKQISCPDNATFIADYAEVYDNLYSQIVNYQTQFNTGSVQFAEPNITITTDDINYEKTKVYRDALYLSESTVVSGCKPSGVSYSSTCVTNCSSSNLSSPTTEPCFQKAILSSADVLLGLSYMATCSYLTDVAFNATKAGSSCDKMGDGFIYQFGSQGAMGILYFLVIFVGVQGFHVWRQENRKENKDEVNAELQAERVRDSVSFPGGAHSLGDDKNKVETAEEIEERKMRNNLDTDQLKKLTLDYYSKPWTEGMKIGPLPECEFTNYLDDLAEVYKRYKKTTYAEKEHEEKDPGQDAKQEEEDRSDDNGTALQQLPR